MTDRSPSLLERRIAAQRAPVLTHDEDTLKRMRGVYVQARTRIVALTKDLTAEIAERIATGETITAGQTFRLTRYRELAALVETEMTRLAVLTGRETVAGQRALARVGAAQAEALVAASLGSPATVVAGFTRLATPAIEAMVGALSDGSPLASLLRTFGPEADAAIRASLIRGLATGAGLDSVAAEIVAATDLQAARALTVVRTETLRAMREGSRQTMIANRDIVPTYRRSAALNESTCSECLALDGTIQSVDEIIPSHPCCRCFLSPIIAGEDPPDWETGADWFERQPADVQDRILESSALGNRVRAGDFTLRDLTRVDNDPRWGPTTRRATIAEAEASAERRVRRVA